MFQFFLSYFPQAIPRKNICPKLIIIQENLLQFWFSKNRSIIDTLGGPKTRTENLDDAFTLCFLAKFQASYPVGRPLTVSNKSWNESLNLWACRQFCFIRTEQEKANLVKMLDTRPGSFLRNGKIREIEIAKFVVPPIVVIKLNFVDFRTTFFDVGALRKKKWSQCKNHHCGQHSCQRTER